MQDTGTYSLALKPSHGHSPYPHGQPHHRRMNNLNPDITDIADFDFASSKPSSDIANITGTRKTSLPKLVPSTSLLTSAPLMPYGQPFPQHLYCHRHRDNLIAVKWKTSWPTSAPLMLYQRIGPHRRYKSLQPHHFVYEAFLKTLAKLATVLVGECVNTRLVPFCSFTSLQ